MTRRLGRYPHEFLTRGDLGPTGCHRAAVFLRDDYRCIAARSATALAVPCAGALVARHVLGDERAELTGPLYLRTFCVAHATLAAVSTPFQDTCRQFGWAIPADAADPAGYAAAVPVRYPNQRWYRLDDWADRHALTGDEVLTARARLGFPPPIRRPT